ncbi:hypothetical protein [Aneurinibacillus aneurinilyticus]|jgi:phage FluMu protein Com|uniref:hypothetical protein n=1 Tax=Aneurinibacillus aneurinilyticus TaxID=1391 RepID=UPI0023F896FE|nr:hypothetical protein [Aneurinibacillus aneurinilyticus]MCI1693295.1 hypothetical protein [Aneurinibacillus aneurinilyticus]
MSKTFGNLDDLFKELKKNPLKYAVGQVIEKSCPACKKVTKIKVIKEDKLKCLSCNSEIKVDEIKWV